jgi:deoxycytidylate deaminase
VKPDYVFDWADLAFGSKKPVRELKATFIAAPREISAKRFTQLVKQYLPKGNIILGLAREPFIEGLDGQPQFRTLQATTVQAIIDKVNQAPQANKIYTLAYAQRETRYLFEKLDFARVVLLRGSWKFTFHTQAPYYALVNRGTPYEMLSPFADEDEARTYEAATMQEITQAHPFAPGKYSEAEMFAKAQQAAAYSFDYSFQTGTALGKKTGGKYDLLAWSYNKVVPFQTYAMHHGTAREQNFSPPNDLNHYDTVHAEVELVVQAGKQRIDLAGTTLFINLLPCPSCARMFAETDIAEFVYQEDHSSGYAIKMLEAASKEVRRLVI